MLKVTIEHIYDIPHTKLLHHSVLSLMDAKGNTHTDTIQTFSYDELGHVVHIDRGGTAADMSYEYDLLHGWVKSIQSAGGFSQTLKREAGGLYNGSIASMSWMMPNDMVERTYHYTYDGLNRLTNSVYGESAYATPTDDVVCPGDDESIPALGVSALHQLIPQSMLSLNDEAGISIQSAGGYRGNPFDDDEMIVEEEPLFENKYGESVTYDKNSNITTLKRCGMLNNRTYGLIDDLTIEYNGNQRKKVTDAVTEHLTYDGASDFEDNSSASTQYLYHPNGTIKRDLNRRLVNNILDDQGHTKALNFSGNKYIYYVYAADGTKLRVSHESPVFATGSNVVLYWLRDTTEYCGNLTLKNGHLHTYQFPGGYASFDGDTLSGWHYYVQDYQGNNRMVVNARTNEVEQTTHYYPYGGVIGDLSTNRNAQDYKFSGKELDHTYGLDWSDFHARQYDAIVPWFTSPDPLAWDYTSLSPYNYCAGDPVNLVDPTGMAIYYVNADGHVILAKQTEDQYDELVSENGAKIRMNDQSILSGLTTNSHDNGDGTSTIWTNSSSNKELMNLMYFLHDNTSIEWSMSKYNDGSSTLGAYMGYTPKGGELGASPSSYAELDGHNANQEVKNIHSHIENYDPSGSYTIYNDGKWRYDRKKNPTRTKSDQLTYENKFNNVFGQKHTKMPLCYVLYKGRITQYTFDVRNLMVYNRKSFVW